MIAANFSTVRENFKAYCDKVIDDCDSVIITRKEGRNIVMISQEEYDNMIENLFIMGNKELYDRLIEAKEQLEAGKGKFHDLIEVDEG